MSSKIKTLLILCSFSSILFAQGNGTRFDLTEALALDPSAGQFAQLFIPDYFECTSSGEYTLVFHFHSASWAAEDEVYRDSINAILFNIHLGAFSSPYQNFFSQSYVFQSILNYINNLLSSENIITNPIRERLIVTSFSAGYAGVREILKTSSYYNEIDALILADGLHASSDPALEEIQLADFVRFARDARDSEKIMLMTHSSIPTSGYASTTQTANYLLQHIGAERESCYFTDEIGTCTSRCDTGNFHLRGYTGTTAEHHLRHLYAMHLMLKQAVNILDMTTTGLKGERRLPESFGYLRVYPNPFNPETEISFCLEKRANLSIEIFNLLGRNLKTWHLDGVEPGWHKIEWKGTDRSEKPVSSGTYLLLLKSYGDNAEPLFMTRAKCVLIR